MGVVVVYALRQCSKTSFDQVTSGGSRNFVQDVP